MYPRFMALLRDLSFFSLTLLAIAFYVTALKIQAMENPYRAGSTGSGVANYPGR